MAAKIASVKRAAIMIQPSPIQIVFEFTAFSFRCAMTFCGAIFTDRRPVPFLEVL